MSEKKVPLFFNFLTKFPFVSVHFWLLIPFYCFGGILSSSPNCIDLQFDKNPGHQANIPQNHKPIVGVLEARHRLSLKQDPV